MSARYHLAVCLLLLQLLQLVQLAEFVDQIVPRPSAADISRGTNKAYKTRNTQILGIPTLPPLTLLSISAFVMIIIEKKFLAAFVLIFAGEHSLKLHM